ncbi:MAG: hypothetical protein K1Y02_11930 [Candidatus Hydrogenedentes bacterium]|nr:hypothetical protein [Candidatus Hydrogenedentota bacterium]
MASTPSDTSTRTAQGKEASRFPIWKTTPGLPDAQGGETSKPGIGENRKRQSDHSLPIYSLRLVPVALIVVAFSCYFCSVYFPGVDDAYISLRYALNFFRGDGLIWNPGQEAVQGYSNLLYTLLLSVGFLFFDKYQIYEWAFVINVLAGIGVVLVLFRFFRSSNRLGEGAALTMAYLLALCPALSYWIWSGMETIPVLFLQVLVWIAVQTIVDKKERNGSLLFIGASVLLVLSRADGFVMPVFGVAYLALVQRQVRTACILGGIVALTFVSLALWQHAYYGDWLPNTVRAKVQDGTLPERILVALKMLFVTFSVRGTEIPHTPFFFRLGLWLPLLAVTCHAFVVIRKDGFKGLPFPSFFVWAWLLYWIRNGGDHFDDRFLVLWWPAGLYSAVWLSNLPARHSYRCRLLVILTVSLVYALSMIPSQPGGYNAYSFKAWPKDLYDHVRQLADLLNRRYNGEYIAVIGAGYLPYFSGNPAVDCLGLNDRTIACTPAAFQFPGHNKHNEQYLMSRRPKVIFTTPISELDSNDPQMLTGGHLSLYESNGYRWVDLWTGRILDPRTGGDSNISPALVRQD